MRALDVAAPGPGGIEAFLGSALSPPSPRALANAIDVLRRISALDAMSEQLTTLGEHLASLPMDPRVGKTLIFAALLGCVEPVLTIVAILSYRSPFVMPLHAKQEADRTKQVTVLLPVLLRVTFCAFCQCILCVVGPFILPPPSLPSLLFPPPSLRPLLFPPPFLPSLLFPPCLPSSSLLPPFLLSSSLLPPSLPPLLFPPSRPPNPRTH